MWRFLDMRARFSRACIGALNNRRVLALPVMTGLWSLQSRFLHAGFGANERVFI